MSKAQGFILIALLLTALIALAAHPADAGAGAASLISVGNVKGTFTSKFILAWVVGVIGLVLLGDASPQLAGGLAGVILLGAILINGPKALKNLGVKSA